MIKTYERNVGALLSQYLVGQVHEKTVFTSLLLMQSGLAVLVQLLKIGSAAMFFLCALPLFVVLLINPLFSGNTKTISLATYFLGQILPLLTGSLLGIPTIEVFVPLVSVVLLCLYTLLFTIDACDRWVG